MTSEVKNFIELSDILKMRFECKGCKAALELALDEVKQGSIRQCPHCRAGWAAFQGADQGWNDHEGLFTGLAQGIQKAEGFSRGGVIGFSLKLEIKQP